MIAEGGTERGHAVSMARGPTMVTVADIDGRYLCTEVVGGLTGPVLGEFAARGTARVSWVDYSPTG